MRGAWYTTKLDKYHRQWRISRRKFVLTGTSRARSAPGRASFGYTASTFQLGRWRFRTIARTKFARNAAPPRGNARWGTTNPASKDQDLFGSRPARLARSSPFASRTNSQPRESRAKGC